MYEDEISRIAFADPDMVRNLLPCCRQTPWPGWTRGGCGG